MFSQRLTRKLTGSTCVQKKLQTSAARLTTLLSSNVSNLALSVNIPDAINSRRSDDRRATMRAGGDLWDVATMWE